MSVTKWRVFCNTENLYISGYLADNIIPSVCFNNNEHQLDVSKTKCLEKIYKNNTEYVTQWRIFCDTESNYVTGYIEGEERPEKCFNNNTHVVSRKAEIIEKIKNNTIRIKEESTETGGNFKSICPKLVCPVGTSTHDFTFPYPISAMSITLNTSSVNTDHQVWADVGSDTTIGIITSDVGISDTIINVSPTVIGMVAVGYYIKLDNGSETEDLGVVTNVNLSNNTITVSTASTQNFLASSPTYVKTTVNIIENFTIGYPGRYELGKDKIGGSYVPSNTIIRVTYNNTGETVVNFYTVIEYLY